MKRILVISLITISTFGYSQEVTKALSDSICNCITTKVPTTSTNYVVDTIDKCKSSIMAPNVKALFEEYGVEGYTVENIRLVYNKVYARLEKKCKLYKKMLK